MVALKVISKAFREWFQSDEDSRLKSAREDEGLADFLLSAFVAGAKFGYEEGWIDGYGDGVDDGMNK